MEEIKKRLFELRQKIKTATTNAGRDSDSVCLVAVTKSQAITKIQEAVAAGQIDFGENYAQELLEHVGIGENLRWHFIGHLQRNKVRQVIDKVSLIHSVDSIDLAREIDKRAAALSKIQPVLIEINLAGEESKSGIAEANLESLITQMNSLDHVLLKGLMTLPPYREEAEESRPFFRRLREIRDAINKRNLYKHPLTELSMGMSQDFEIAIEEGATLLRIGTGIFGERKH